MNISSLVSKLFPGPFTIARLSRGVLISALAFLLWACGSTVKKTTPTEPGVQAPPAASTAEPNIRACLIDNVERSALSFDGNYVLVLEEARYRFDSSIGTLNVFRSGKNLVFRNDRRYLDIAPDQQIVFRPQTRNSEFTLDNVTYRGELRFVFDGDKVIVVNEVALERYLQGVVPFEIPTHQNGYRDAAFAQAIAARTYAMHRLANPVNSNIYDIRADTRDQVYRGVDRMTDLAQRAVNNTRGMILTERGEPTATFYHSTCGGILESTAMMPGSAVPAGAAVAHDLDKDEYNCRVSPFYRWVEIRDAETILLNLQREFDIDSLRVEGWLNDGFTMSIEVLDRKPSSRAQTVRFRVEEQTFLADGSRIRRSLADERGKILPSDLFFVNLSPENQDKFYIIGAGNGHGRGMCQWGAIGMSLAGRQYQSILGFYYPDLTLAQMY